MNYTFNKSSIVSVNSGTIVLNVSGKTRTFVDAKLVSAVDGNIVLDLPEPTFKKGTYVTFVAKDKIERTFILSKYTDIKIYYHVSTNFLGLAFNDFWFISDNQFRNATPEEIQELNDQLAAEGKRWNPETMQIEKRRWKPIEGESYFTIVIGGGDSWVSQYTWQSDNIDNHVYVTGNCFRTREEAEAKLEQIKKLLLEV